MPNITQPNLSSHTTPNSRESNIFDIIAQQYEQFTPSDMERTTVEAVFKKFRHSAMNRNRNFEYFDGLNLTEYINDSVRRFTTNIDERDGLEDWQARVHDPFTRNKVIAVLGKVVANLPIAQFKSRGEQDVRKGTLLTNLYEYVEDKEDYEETMTQLLLESIVKGTAIAYEGVVREERKIRNIKGFGDDITVSEGKEEETRFPTTIVPLEDFYPSSVMIRTIKNMPFCFWRSVIPHSTFMQEWGQYDKAKYVVPKFSLTGTQVPEKKPFYFDFISQDISDGNVEVVRYYNRQTDEFIIVANGVWLNPLNVKKINTESKDQFTGEEVSPLPFNHKELPFFEIKFDYFGDWFYGKSLPDRLKSMQDVLNVLTNMLLDQSFLTIFPPILTNGSDSIEDDYLRPGRRTPIDTQGQPLNAAFMKLDLGVPSSWHQFILEYTKKIMEQSSLDQVSSGQAGVGGRTTAQEINVAAKSVENILGIFGMLVKYGVKRKAMLKGANILQFATDTKIPLVKRVLGDGDAEDFTDAFNTVTVDGTILTDGRRGMKIIEMYQDTDKMPNKDQLKARSTISEADTGKPVEIIAITPQSIRNFIFDVMVVENPKTEQSKDMAKAMQLEKVRVYVSMFPNQVDMNELAAQTAEKLGDDPSKILKQDVMNPAPPKTEGNPEAAQGMSQSPQGNVASNMVKGAAPEQASPSNINVLLKGGVGGV